MRRKVIRGSGGRVTRFIILAQVGGVWSASRPDRFIPAETALRTHHLGGWVRITACLEVLLRSKLFCHGQESKSLPIYRLAIRLAELYWLPNRLRKVQNYQTQFCLLCGTAQLKPDGTR